MSSNTEQCGAGPTSRRTLSSSLTSGPGLSAPQWPSILSLLILTFWHNTVTSGWWIDGSVWPWMEREQSRESRKRAVYVQSRCDEINGYNGLVQMEDRGGQGELGRKMKTITALLSAGASRRSSEVTMLGWDSYPMPCWPLNSEHWYQPLLPQMSSPTTPATPTLSVTFLQLWLHYCRSVCNCSFALWQCKVHFCVAKWILVSNC